jgi:hypothetical protein
LISSLSHSSISSLSRSCPSGSYSASTIGFDGGIDADYYSSGSSSSVISPRMRIATSKWATSAILIQRLALSL